MKFWLKNMRAGDYLGDLSLERKILHWIMYSTNCMEGCGMDSSLYGPLVGFCELGE